MQIDIKVKDIKALRKLIKELNNYYKTDDCWSFEDVDGQRQIACEMAEILEEYIIPKKTNG
ncbi:hypothetical protein BN938_2270 [Mucinivorans hirudinis]|uniref:Uncharacterized protein n=1 Tax=Mucinivorans hirudinis TaxID=1433126 RepID=A0A060R9V3_9BACT|nr:hypothetical protein BN938_2270 [Mucinivorans hirudinis]